MKGRFEIVGGVVYLDKSLYIDSMKVDNDLSKLTGSTCVNMFKARPHIQSGIESVTIDYHYTDGVTLDQNPFDYVEELRQHYQSRVRGHLIVDVGEAHPIDLTINRF